MAVEPAAIEERCDSQLWGGGRRLVDDQLQQFELVLVAPGDRRADTQPRGERLAERVTSLSDESGNVLGLSGLTTQGSVIVKSGLYVLQFDRDLSKCARVATIGGDQAAFITAELLAPNVVQVTITGPQTPGIKQAQPFSLALFC